MEDFIMPLSNLNYSFSLQNFIVSQTAKGMAFHILRGDAHFASLIEQHSHELLKGILIESYPDQN